MSPLRFLILSLGVFGLARVMACEDGPAMLLTKTRLEVSNLNWVQDFGLPKLVSCPYCLGVWLAALGATQAKEKRAEVFCGLVGANFVLQALYGALGGKPCGD